VNDLEFAFTSFARESGEAGEGGMKVMKSLSALCRANQFLKLDKAVGWVKQSELHRFVGVSWWGSFHSTHPTLKTDRPCRPLRRYGIEVYEEYIMTVF